MTLYGSVRFYIDGNYDARMKIGEVLDAMKKVIHQDDFVGLTINLSSENMVIPTTSIRYWVQRYNVQVYTRTLKPAEVVAISNLITGINGVTIIGIRSTDVILPSEKEEVFNSNIESFFPILTDELLDEIMPDENEEQAKGKEK